MSTGTGRTSDGGFRILRWSLALLAIVAGADKFFHRIASWEMYLAAPIEALLPVAPATFLAIGGAVEIAVGLALLGRFGRAAAYVQAAWLAAIAAQILLTGLFYDVALRDAALAAAALALARMPQWESRDAVRVTAETAVETAAETAAEKGVER